MADVPLQMAAHEIRLARRLARLFRVERGGILARRPAAVAARLTDRRGQLIAALMRADAARRSLHLAASAELLRAVDELWRETGLTRRSADIRLGQLRADLLISRGEGIPSGLRGGAQRRVIGRV